MQTLVFKVTMSVTVTIRMLEMIREVDSSTTITLHYNFYEEFQCTDYVCNAKKIVKATFA